MTSVPSDLPPAAASCAAAVPLRDAFAPLRRRDDAARTAMIPPLPVEPALIDEIAACCRPGESLLQFVEGAVRASLRRRAAQADFVARRAAALDQARRAGLPSGPGR
jgi:hypothetical protein